MTLLCSRVTRSGSRSQNLQSLQRSARGGRGKRVGEQVGTTALHQIVDEISGACHEAAVATTQRLAVGAGQDVDAVGAPGRHLQVLVTASAAGAKHTGAVRVVDHQHRFVLPA